MDSFHLRGGSSFGPFLLFEAVAVLYTPCMLYGVLAFSNAYLVYLSKKKKKKNIGELQWLLGIDIHLFILWENKS